MSFLVLLWLYCFNTIITTNGSIKFPFKSVHLQSKVSLFHSSRLLLELKVLQSSVANKHDVLMKETTKIKKEIQEFQMTLAAIMNLRNSNQSFVLSISSECIVSITLWIL